MRLTHHLSSGNNFFAHFGKVVSENSIQFGFYKKDTMLFQFFFYNKETSHLKTSQLTTQNDINYEKI